MHVSRDDPTPIPQSSVNTRRRIIILTSVQLVLFYIRCLITAMASTTRNRWTNDETEQLLRYILDRRSEMGEAGSFKPAFYSGASEAVTSGRWAGKQCHNKWDSVSPNQD